MLAIQSALRSKSVRFYPKRLLMIRFGKKIIKYIIVFFVCFTLYLRCGVLEMKDIPQEDSQRIETQIMNESKPESTLRVLKTTSPTTATAERIRDKYIKVGYFDIKGNDLACDKNGNCQEFQVRSAEHAMMLCHSYLEDCRGFVFDSNSGRLFLKTNVDAEPIEDPFLEFYVKVEFRKNVNLLEERQCAVPIEDFHNLPQFKCNLPALDPFNVNIMKYMKKEKVEVVCRGEHYTTYTDGVLMLLRTDFNTMDVKAIRRKPHNDWDYELIPKTIDLSGKKFSKINEEFLQIETTILSGQKIVEYHAEVVPKLEVLQRERTGKGLSVLLVGFDSTSSAQMQRALPKVYDFLKDDLNSHMFSGYSIVGDGTTPQLTAMLTGQTEVELPEARRGYPNSSTVDSWPWIFKEFRKHGYATLYSEDDAYYNAFNYRLHGFRDPPADHYTRPFWLAAPTEGYCVKSTPQPLLHFDYIESFLKAYRHIPKIGLAFLASISHSNMNTLRPAEVFVLKFFKSIWKKGYLNDTVLITFSDHGMRFGEARATMQSHLEERLPFLSIALPKSIREKYPQFESILKDNTKKLLSPFDIHVTLRHILNFPNIKPQKIGSSLLENVLETRSCAACGIPAHYCPCVQLQQIPITHVHVQKAAEGFVAHINKILKADELASEMCSTLKLGEVKSAYQNLNHPKLMKFMGSKDIDGRIPRFGNHTSDYECNYQLLVRTFPGGGLFEVTVQLLDGKFHYGNEISRINKYGDQPRCLAERKPYLRKFCVCKELRK